MTLHPAIRSLVIKGVVLLQEQGVFIRIVQAMRSIEAQNALYAQGRTTAGDIVTWAVGGKSYHNYGLAFDFCLLHGDRTISWSRSEDLDQDHMPDWQEVVSVFKSLGFVWGGTFPKGKEDYPHFQFTFDKTVSELFALYTIGRIQDGFVILA